MKTDRKYWLIAALGPSMISGQQATQGKPEVQEGPRMHMMGARDASRLNRSR
jgi:hypothetical protein